MQRAEKAAHLLERGFSGGGGLSWLIPSFGTVDALQPVDAAPPNLRDEICNAKGRRKWVPSDNDEEPVAHTAEGSDSSLAMMAGFQLGPAKQGSLIGPLTPSMAPIPVYTGPARSPGAIELASAPAAKKKPPRKTAAPSGTTSPSQTASTSSGDPKAKTPPAPQRPAGSNTGSAKPAAAVQQGPSTDPARATKPKPKAKPAAAKQPNNG
jgi:D-alanyl-D-alanine carboxypeptidase